MSQSIDEIKTRIAAEIDADRRIRFEQLRITGKDAQIQALFDAIDALLKENSELLEGQRQYKGCWDENNHLKTENASLRAIAVELTVLDRMVYDDESLAPEKIAGCHRRLAATAKVALEKGAS